MLRKNRLIKKIKELGLDCLILKKEVNRFYLTGVASSYGWVIITENQSYFLVDSRYIIAAQKAAEDFEVVEISSFKEWWQGFCRKNTGAKVGFESDDLTHQQLSVLKNRKIKLVVTQDIVESSREVKDEKEVIYIKESLKIAESTFKDILKIMKTGMTELEVAWQIEKLIREKGGEKAAWYPFIVAAGKNSAEPHHRPDQTEIKNGDTVQLDFGAVTQGYHSDISRVVFMGKPTDEQRNIYEKVLGAQEYGKSFIRVDEEIGIADKEVREKLHESVKPEFVYHHSLGHGVGLEVHELPTVHSGRKEKFKAGQVVTVEPAVYIPDWGGVRLEDEVLVTKRGAETLNNSTKKIQEVTIS